MNLAETMFPSRLYIAANFVPNVLLPLALPSPFPAERIAFCLTTILSSQLGGAICLPPAIYLGATTSAPIYKINDKYPNLARKVAWLSPAINIGAITAASYALFNFIANPYAKAAIFGIHQIAIGILGRSQLGWTGVITLDNGFSKLIGVSEELTKSLTVDIKRIENVSEVIACTAFIVSTIGLAYLGFHPILNSAISAATASTAKALSIRVQLALAPLKDVFPE